MSIFDFFKKKGEPEKQPVKRAGEGLADEIKRLAKNQIRVEIDKRAKDISADTSKIGGKPYLPVDFAWPVYTDKDDGETRPLSFFCQIKLADVKALDKDGVLPDKGIMSFFYECDSFCWGFDPADKGAVRAYYHEDMAGFAPFDIPADLSEEYVMPELALKFTSEVSYPKFEEFSVHSNMNCDWEEYDDALAQLGADPDEGYEGHKLLGYADIIQDEMLTECERSVRGLYSGNPESYQNTSEEDNAEILANAKDWVLLLQLSTIEKGDFTHMFGDCGMLYYYIKKEDLYAKRFENIWFSLQCG